MLAPGCSLELIQDSRIITAATSPMATPIKGLSAVNQTGFVFMLFSQAFEGRHFT
jgi:hypothetical protein